MRNERRNTTLGMLMMVVGTAFLGACAMDAEVGKEPPSEQAVVTVDEQTPNEPKAATSSTDEGTPRVSCRRVTASSIPVFTAPNSNTVLCRFFSGDRFSYFNVVQASGFPARLTTWCPRGVPPAQGTTAYAQISGTVDGGCG